ncbi:MAG: membrane dipeptidase [Herpetosiphon sp.]
MSANRNQSQVAPVRDDPAAGWQLVDSHLDLAFNAVQGLDLRLPLAELRQSTAGAARIDLGMTPTVCLPSLKQANVRLAFATLFVLPAAAGGRVPGLTYATTAEAHAQATDQLAYYRHLASEGHVIIVTNRTMLQDVAQPATADPGPLKLVVLMEGADPVQTPDDLHAWFQAGVRLLGPAWGATRYSGGTHAPGPLTEQGRQLVREFAACGMALDTSHLAEESFWEALDIHKGAVCASHSNCRSLVPTDRQLSDKMIRAIADRGGVVGVVLYNRFLEPNWNPGDSKAAVSLRNVVAHIEHICELVGSTRHVGIGSDMDGGFGVEGIPVELQSCKDLPLIGTALSQAGWQDGAISDVLGGNWQRWLELALPA